MKNNKINYVLEPVGEAYELYIDGEYVKTFSAFAESYQNIQDAEEYVKNNYFKNEQKEKNVKDLNTIDSFIHKGVYYIERDGQVITLSSQELNEIDMLNKAWNGRCTVETFQDCVQDKELLYMLKRDPEVLAEIDGEIYRANMENIGSLEEEVVLGTINYYKNDFLENLPATLANDYFSFLKDGFPYDYQDAMDELDEEQILEDYVERIQNGDIREFLEEMEEFLFENEGHEDFNRVYSLKNAMESYVEHRLKDKVLQDNQR